MKKILLLTTALCAMLLLWCTASAADIGGITIVSRDDAVALTLLDAEGKTVNKEDGEQYPHATRLQIIVPKPTAGAEYLLTAQDAEGNPTEENLVFIDQRKSTDGSSLTFTVYPSRAALGKTYSVYLSSASDNRARVVTFRYFEEEIIPVNVMGDVTGDGEVRVDDAQRVLQIIVDILDRSSLTAEQTACADVNKNGSIDIGDAVKILRYVAEVIPSLD